MPFTRVAGVLPVYRFLVAIGAPADRIAFQVGLPVRQLGCPEALIPFFVASRYYGAAARAVGMANLGSHVGLTSAPWGPGSFGRLLLGARTLHEAMLRAVRLIGTFSSSHRCWLREEGPIVWFGLRFVDGAEDGTEQMDLLGIARVIAYVRSVVGSAWDPEWIEAPHRSRALLRVEPSWRDVRIRFTERHSAVAIPREFLSLGLRGGTKLSIGGEKPMEPPPSDWEDSLGLVIRGMLGEGPPTLIQVASAAGMSRRSLQRHLAESGQTFSGIVAAVRLARAIELLRNPASKAIEISHELGYADPANFTRAFHRWTGVSPRKYRTSSTGRIT